MRTPSSAKIGSDRTARLATRQPTPFPLKSWLAILPATQLAAAFIYRGDAPMRMYVISAVLFAVAATVHCFLYAAYRCLPAAFSDKTWRGLGTAAVFMGCLAQGVSGALFTMLPGDQQLLLLVASMCFVTAIVPSRWRGLQFGLAVFAFLAPTVGLFAVDNLPLIPLSLLTILGGALVLFKFASYDKRRPGRRATSDANGAPGDDARQDEWGAHADILVQHAPRPRAGGEPDLRSKSALLAVLSHDLRTPMNSLIGTIELLEREDLTKHQLQLVQAVQLSATSLLGVVDNVLDRALSETAGGVAQGTPAYTWPSAIAPVAATPEYLVSADRTSADSEGRASCDTVLVVDDSELNLRVLCEQLRTLGVPADTAADGLQGLAKWRSRRYALVIADIQMPCMNGIEMTSQIRAEEARSGTGERTPIIALTADTRRGVEQVAIASGFDGCLTKPLMLRRLRETVEHWSAARAASAGNASPPANVSPIDRRALLETVGGNNDVADAVLLRFAAVGAGLIEEIAAAAQDGDQLKRLAHKLKGIARSVCASRLADLAEKLEASRNAAGIAALEQEWSRVAATLQRLQVAPVREAV
ncbi:MAG TPA: response regulator [Reyranella sp.]|nr:response regulator [Reyranella sp.]